MGWYSTAMYLGIAIAPPLGNLSLGLGGPWLVPVAGAVVSAIALGLFLLADGGNRAGYRTFIATRRTRDACAGASR
jgi:predicted MFS family arabinose efflux permease